MQSYHRWFIDIDGQSQGRTTNNFCWKFWYILHRQSTELDTIESSCIDLNNDVVVWNTSENTKKWKPMAQDLYSYHVWEFTWSEYKCKYEYWAVEYEYMATRYEYLWFVLEYYSSMSTEYYNSVYKVKTRALIGYSTLYKWRTGYP